MRVLIVYCHPNANSFCSHLNGVAIETLTRAECEVRVIDLYGCGFNPVLNTEELVNYQTAHVNEQPVDEYLELLRWSEGLLFVYPSWWSGLPAMLKGWLDRVFVPHAAFSNPDAISGWRPLLTNIKSVGVITTFGAPYWLASGIRGNAGKKTLRVLCACFAQKCQFLWLAQYRIDAVSASERERFVVKVQRQLVRKFVR